MFFFIDPAFLDDPALATVKTVTLSYTFFRTGDKEVLDIASEILKSEAGPVASGGPHEQDSTRERIRRWTEEVAAKTAAAGVATGASGGGGVAANGAATAASPAAPPAA